MTLTPIRFSNVMTALLTAAVALSAVGCSNMERRKFVFWGDVVYEKPESVSDHWSDYGPFKLNDPSKKLRRGKAGVVRFFKEKDFLHSIPVEGELIVYVYQGEEEGVELTEPLARLVLTNEQLNSQRKFDKKNGYSYHIWLDLGEIDAPAQNISILTVFNDAATRDQVASGITYTRIGGTEKGPESADNESESGLDPVAWARKYRQTSGMPLLSDAERESLIHQSPSDSAAASATLGTPEKPGESSNGADAPGAAGPTTIELSPTLTRQMTADPSGAQPAATESRYAAYLKENPKGQWKKMPEGTAIVPPDLTAQNPSAISKSPTADSKAKTLTFDELRAVSGPNSAGAYFTTGVVEKGGNVQLNALNPGADGSTGLF